MALATGCEDRPSTPSPSVRAKPDAEESLKYIVDTFRRIVEDADIGFVIHNSGGRSMMYGRNKVSYELVRPSAANENYRAIVTVKSTMHYSVQREKDPDGDSQKDNRSMLPEDDSSVEVLDSDLISQPAADTSRSQKDVEKITSRKQDEDSRQYELVYEKGRWELKTKLDHETERLIQDAFQRALRTQA